MCSFLKIKRGLRLGRLRCPNPTVLECTQHLAYEPSCLKMYSSPAGLFLLGWWHARHGSLPWPSAWSFFLLTRQLWTAFQKRWNIQLRSYLGGGKQVNAGLCTLRSTPEHAYLNWSFGHKCGQCIQLAFPPMPPCLRDATSCHLESVTRAQWKAGLVEKWFMTGTAHTNRTHEHLRVCVLFHLVFVRAVPVMNQSQ